jgi:hypothetical protein
MCPYSGCCDGGPHDPTAHRHITCGHVITGGFATVVIGMDVVDSILEGDQIQEIKIVEARKSS